ncbi:unnamed protein product [Polarella glacialis]|uniref:dCTP pyrophosphatase 1 n=1 Tax=Polarella glacialis TaxID=89957 RepID=A0A813J6U4_POLGL|nr:unnamed protein product [Polarella glacialis]
MVATMDGERRAQPEGTAGSGNIGLENDGSTKEVVAALAKQLGLDIAVVERIFHAGVTHAEFGHKRRRICSSNGTPATEAKGSASAPEAASATATGSVTEGEQASAADFSFTRGLTLEDLRLELAEFAKARDWDEDLLVLVGARQWVNISSSGGREECKVGELCECFQWKGEVPEGLPGWKDKERTHLAQEIADVFLYLIRLSHKCHVDLPTAALDKLALNAAKYPASLVRGSSRKYTEFKTAAREGPSDETS